MRAAGRSSSPYSYNEPINIRGNLGPSSKELQEAHLIDALTTVQRNEEKKAQKANNLLQHLSLNRPVVPEPSDASKSVRTTALYEKYKHRVREIYAASSAATSSGVSAAAQILAGNVMDSYAFPTALDTWLEKMDNLTDSMRKDWVHIDPDVNERAADAKESYTPSSIVIETVDIASDLRWATLITRIFRRIDHENFDGLITTNDLADNRAILEDIGGYDSVVLELSAAGVEREKISLSDFQNACQSIRNKKRRRTQNSRSEK